MFIMFFHRMYERDLVIILGEIRVVNEIVFSIQIESIPIHSISHILRFNCE